MKEAILRIEVPDDFKKGMHCCPLHGWIVCNVNGYLPCGPKNCPLEVLDEDIPMEYFENGGV